MRAGTNSGTAYFRMPCCSNPSHGRDYDSLLNGLRNDLKPEGTLEDLLVEKLAILTWRYRQLVVAETSEIENGRILTLEADLSTVLGRFLQYEAGIERAEAGVLVLGRISISASRKKTSPRTDAGCGGNSPRDIF